MQPDSMRAWMRLAPTLGLLTLLFLLFRDTAAAMVAIWVRSETFTHAFLVPPIAGWLIWRQRHLLATLPDRPVPWLLMAVAGACFLWLLGELATVDAASQFALVSLVAVAVIAVHGWQVGRVLAFPLAFLYFTVPLGEFLVPTLMEGTADFTVLALQASGIPVYREGLQFVIPTGTWSVVQACSGVRYLIASFMVGTLFAYLNYASMPRRVAFMAVSLVVPVFANWLRAYMIVMIGHLSGNELATGVDHLIYGWVFFGIVIGLMFMIGARWADAGEPLSASASGPAERPALGRVVPVVAGAAVLLLATQAVLWWLDQDSRGEPRASDLQFQVTGRWRSEAGPTLPWQPGFDHPSVAVAQAYRQGDRTAWAWVGYYRHQGPDRKLVSSVNGLVGTQEKAWAQVSRGSTQVILPSGRVALRSAEIRRGSLDGAGTERLKLLMVYRVADRWTTSDATAKLLQAAQRLTGQGDDGAVVILATRAGPQADLDVGTLAQDLLDPLGRRLDGMRAAP
jgi:exosortase A